MAKHKDDGYLDAVQERMDGDVLKAMLEVIVRRVMEEETARHSGARGSRLPAGIPSSFAQVLRLVVHTAVRPRGP